jgi:hypothetical protein
MVRSRVAAIMTVITASASTIPMNIQLFVPTLRTQ